VKKVFLFLIAVVSFVFPLISCSQPKASDLSIRDTLKYANVEAENVRTACIAYYADNEYWPFSSSDIENKYLDGRLRAYYIFDTGFIASAIPIPPDGWAGIEWSGEEWVSSSAKSPTSQKPATMDAEKTPVLIGEWSGNGIKTTEPFTVSATPWLVGWTNKEQGIFQVMVYSVSDPNVPVAIVANTAEPMTDSSYVYHSGRFYLTINATTSWSVKVAGVP
jgi:hypothetical protein